MKKITEITSEREFISKLRTYYRKARRKDYQRNEISFLGLMEYIGSATSEFEYQSEKYFSVGIRAYDWVHGNSLLSALIDKWENEIEAEKRKKQAATPTETPRISTETAEMVNVSAEGEIAAEVKRMVAMIEPYKNIDRYALTGHYTKLLGAVCLIFGIRREEAREKYGLFTYRQWYSLLTNITTASPQSPETPQTAEYTADTPKPRETARKPQNRGIGNTRHSRLGANGYAMLDNANATLTAMCVPCECSTADVAHW